MNKLYKLFLIPASLLYGLAITIRNALFNYGIIKSKSFETPTISVGNIEVGGTGKTPHTEYLISLLLNTHYNVAVLSRGYKRKTKGYLEIKSNMTYKEAGDEPVQIKQKYPNVIVAVDEDRCDGVENIQKKTGIKTDAIILDDAYQHRYIKPDISILLFDYNNIGKDYLLPAGNRREPLKSINRSDIIIITKCPKEVAPSEIRYKISKLNPSNFQKVYATTMEYGKLTKIDDIKNTKELSSIKEKQVILITGIAKAAPLVKELKEYTKKIKHISYQDHHSYNKKDIKNIKKEFNTIEKDGIIITTEKDAARMRKNPIFEDLIPYIYYIPINVKFIYGDENLLQQYILNYVYANTRDDKMASK